MSNEFKVEIISPDNSILKTNASLVIIPSFEGEMGILRDHIPLITFLRPGLITVGNENFYVEEGTVEFSDNNLLILSSTVQNIKNISSEKKNIMLKDAENKISKNQVSDKQKYILSYKIDTLKQIN